MYAPLIQRGQKCREKHNFRVSTVTITIVTVTVQQYVPLLAMAMQMILLCICILLLAHLKKSTDILQIKYQDRNLYTLPVKYTHEKSYYHLQSQNCLLICWPRHSIQAD